MINSAINPLDGRYFSKTRALSPFFSEEALMSYRVRMEGEYLIALSQESKVGLRKFTSAEIAQICNLYNLSDKDFQEIKDLEKTTNHDVKAVEYFIKEKLKKTSLKDSIEWVHFALTSEDTNNISYALLLSESLEQVMIPEISKVVKEINALAKAHKSLPMLARTHGQSASPTTFGKEMRVFSARLENQLDGLKKLKIQAKLNGATGNYNAHVAAYPNVDWVKFSKKFISGLGRRLEANTLTTQIECHDSYVEVFDSLRRINTILLDFNQDMWRYVSDNWIKQKINKTETGSSTMPHKVNPIDFENSEGNLGLANALFEFFARKLPISRLQRDLSDSTVERAFGTAFGHSFLAYTSLLKGISKVEVNKDKMREALIEHTEVIAEAIQTVLRRENYPIPYEKLKDLTRGKTVSMNDFKIFIESLDVPPKVKKELHNFIPETYIGLAAKLV